MNLSTRLNSLEAKRKAFWCPWCRYSLRTTLNKADALTPDHIEAKCWFCGNTYRIPTTGYSAKLKEAMRLVATSHATQQFTNERVHAAKLWIDFFRCLPLSPYYQGKDEIPDPPKLTKKQQARKDAAEAFYNRQMEQFRRIANGPESFPVDAALAEIDKARETPTIHLTVASECQREVKEVVGRIANFLHVVKSAAACELVLWGEVTPETEAELLFFEREQTQKIAAIVEQAAIVKQVAEHQKPTIEKTARVAQPLQPAPSVEAPMPAPATREPESTVVEEPSMDPFEQANQVRVPSLETVYQRKIRFSRSLRT